MHNRMILILNQVKVWYYFVRQILDLVTLLSNMSS
jgi:hypothetical protein